MRRSVKTGVKVTFTLNTTDAETPIDPVRGRQLMQRSSRGETLTPEEQAYLERVKQEIRKRAAGRRPGPSPQAAGPRSAAVSTNDWSALVPITDMTAPHKGEDGGLYGGERNEPPEAQRAANLKESAEIRPLDADGRPSGDGKARTSDSATGGTLTTFPGNKAMGSVSIEPFSVTTLILP